MKCDAGYQGCNGLMGADRWQDQGLLSPPQRIQNVILRPHSEAVEWHTSALRCTGSRQGLNALAGAPMDPAGAEPSFPRLSKARSYHIDDGPMPTGKNRLTNDRLKLSKTKTAPRGLFLRQTSWIRHLGRASLRLLSYSSQKKSQKLFNDFLISQRRGRDLNK